MQIRGTFGHNYTSSKLGQERAQHKRIVKESVWRQMKGCGSESIFGADRNHRSGKRTKFAWDKEISEMKSTKEYGENSEDWPNTPTFEKHQNHRGQEHTPVCPCAKTKPEGDKILPQGEFVAGIKWGGIAGRFIRIQNLNGRRRQVDGIQLTRQREFVV